MGVSATFGAYGYHQWKKSQLSLSYQGRARHYTRQSNQDGIDQTMALAYNYQPTRRIEIQLGQSLGLYSRSIGLPGLNIAGGQGFGFTPNLSIDPTVPTVPQNDIFDSRTYYLTSSGSVRYHKSNRLSFVAQGTGFTVRRASTSLAGVLGVSASGAVAYRLSRTQTIGAGYTYSQWTFNRSFGDANVQTTFANYKRQLGRRWTAGGTVGVYRLEAVGLRRVGLDPVIAALLGTGSAVEVFYTKTYGTTLAAHLGAQFRHSAVNFGYSRSINPGNGVYLSSQVETLYAAYSYVPFRNWSAGLQATYSRMSPRTQVLNRYQQYTGGANIGRSIFGWLSYNASASVRRYEIVNTGFQRDAYVVSMGFGFSPGEIPVSFW